MAAQSTSRSRIELVVRPAGVELRHPRREAGVDRLGSQRARLRDEGEPALGERLPRGAALHLAARRLGQLARSEERQARGAHLVRVDHRLADPPDEIVPAARGGTVLADLERDAEALLALLVDHGERRGAPRSDCGIHRLHGRLHIVGMDVATADDHHVLHAPADDQAGLRVDEAQIAGAEEGPLARREERAEDRGALLVVAEVPARDPGAAHPDLADHARRAGRARLRVDGEHLGVGHGRSVADERRRGAALRRGPDDHRARVARAAHHQRRLGEPVARAHRGGPEPRRREARVEALQRPGAHRLAAAPADAERREVEAGHVLVGGAAGDEREREVRHHGHLGAEMGERLQPPHRALQEGERREEDARAAGPERPEHAADEAHVVVGRQPGDAEGRGGGGGDRRQVGEEVFVRERDAARDAGRPRGVLEHGQVRRGGPAARPARALVVPDVRGHDDRQRRQALDGGQEAGEVAHGEHRRRGSVAHDGAEPHQRSREPRRIGQRHGHRHHPGQEAPQDALHERGPRRQHQDHAPTLEAHRLQSRRDRGRSLRDAREGEHLRGAVHVARREEVLPGAVRVLLDADAEEIDEALGAGEG